MPEPVILAEPVFRRLDAIQELLDGRPYDGRMDDIRMVLKDTRTDLSAAIMQMPETQAPRPWWRFWR